MEELIQQYTEHAKNGFYSVHLSEISSKGNQAFTTSDILNDKGVLLARKGINIDRDVRQQLIKHKLLKPLDSHIGLEHQADTQTLITEFRRLLEKYPDLNRVNEALQYGPEFEKLLQLERLHPLLTQKLTVLEAQMHSEFEKSIFSAWLSSMIAREMGLSMDERRDILVAALMHDIGLLHLDPDIVCSNRKLSAQEWSTVRAHVIVGKIIADSVPGIYPEVSRAVVEHHEDCFGAGYPFALNEEQLGNPGKIINMTDSIHSIRVKSFRNSQRTLGDIKPYLQLNPTTNGYEVYRATMSIIKKSGLQPVRLRADDCPKDYAKNLGKQIDILREAKQALDDIHENLLELKERIDQQDAKQLSAIAAVTCRIRSTLDESGLLSSEIAAWLCKERELSGVDEQVLGEFNEIELLIKELTWQIRNTVRMFHSYNDSDATRDAMMLEHIEASIESIQEIFDRLD
ncbi:MAG: HD domain-containing protein [Candidatus Thiodiazotropha taylori]|nr:HD domain-containing protein [Candidatus Thiodiazotropha endolucinida]MCG7966603.1 HD domain-containing protein [Candidatus Thiodiazotropha taylori]MCG8049943.1 HD domain-containing protein [Candidatus Thiodiazotropha taylori]MCW4230591.1 HD domain-containing protein [Candidatus Thiodiazotropha taylori]MCW4311760.1 HD domain-containing protein [Candidatus Thiodiazotropha taylori]